MDVDKELCSLMMCEQFAHVPDHSAVPVAQGLLLLLASRLEALRVYPEMEMRYLEAVERHWKPFSGVQRPC